VLFTILNRVRVIAAGVISVCMLSSAIQAGDMPKPTLENVHYGEHQHQVLDFYRADSQQPTPLLFFVHGGAWMTGDKSNPDFLQQCLGAGISLVSINYRLISDVATGGKEPPVKTALYDAARALQFVRGKAREWNVNKDRIGGCGGSAGGFTALWLAFHPDMANPKSTDVIARESTRLCCVLAFVPQTSLDPLQMRQWIPNNDYGYHAFALGSYQEFIAKREALMPWISEFSPYILAANGAPPVYLFYDSVPDIGKPYKDPPHSANYGRGLAEKLKKIGIEYEFNYPGSQELKHPNAFDFLLEKLIKN
jgi:acetyl esterase/lipase